MILLTPTKLSQKNSILFSILELRSASNLHISITARRTTCPSLSWYSIRRSFDIKIHLKIPLCLKHHDVKYCCYRAPHYDVFMREMTNFCRFWQRLNTNFLEVLALIISSLFLRQSQIRFYPLLF